MSIWEIEETRRQHEAILAHWCYPPAIEAELRDSMTKWLAAVKVKR